jgi:hypothetical protein
MMMAATVVETGGPSERIGTRATMGPQPRPRALPVPARTKKGRATGSRELAAGVVAVADVAGGAQSRPTRRLRSPRRRLRMKLPTTGPPSRGSDEVVVVEVAA